MQLALANFALLGTPDGLFTDGAYQNFDPAQTLTEAIDDLMKLLKMLETTHLLEQ